MMVMTISSTFNMLINKGAQEGACYFKLNVCFSET